jgi:hypothetical protein
MKFSKKLLLTQVVALAAASAAFAGSNAPSLSGLVSRGYPVLNPMVSDSVDGFGVNNELFLLTQRQSGAVKDGVLYVNGRLNVAASYGKKQNGNSSSSIHTPGVNLAVTGTKGAATVFVELNNNNNNNNNNNSTTGGRNWGGYNFATSSTTVTEQFNNGVNVKQAYLMLGDLNKSPLYLVAGRKNVDYGSFDNLDWYWKPVTNYWNPLQQDQVAVGLYQNGLHVAGTVFNGSSATGSGGVTNNISNFAVTASYGTMVQKVGAEVGVSYLNGLTTTLNGGAPARATSVLHNTSYRNPAGIVFGKLSFNPVSLSALYQQAFKQNSLNTNGNTYKPRSWGVTGKVDFSLMNRANWVALNYSSSKTGKDTYKGVVDQLLVGWNMALTDAISATLQYGHKHDNNYATDGLNAATGAIDRTDNFFDLAFYAYF